MAAIESVEMRQKGAADFEGYYNNMCALQNSCPLPAVRMYLHEKRLDLNADRIKVVDWLSILPSVKINKTLECISLRSYYQQTVQEQEEKGYTTRRKIPSVLSKEISCRMTKAIQGCLLVSPVLKKVVLQGVHLREKDVQSLSKGIYNSKALEHLSLEQCKVGDKGLEIVVKGLKNCITLQTLNFSGCGLSSAGGEHVAKLIRYQAIRRHNEAWEESLRYRRPDLDRMSGIRRIFLNGNPLLGDEGAQYMAEALKDDLWLKALDLQGSGIGEEGAQQLLSVLKFNTCLVVIDLRQNPLIPNDVLRQMVEHLLINSDGKDSEYKWIKWDSSICNPDNANAVKRKRTKTLHSNFGKKATIKVSTPRGRSRSASMPNKPLKQITENGTVGVPWRAAMRANRCKGYPPDESGSSPDHTSEHVTASEPKYKIEYEYKTNDSDQHNEPTVTGIRATSPSRLSHNQWRQLQVDVEDLKCRYEEERRAREKIDQQVMELLMTNTQLRQHLDDARRRNAVLQDDAVSNRIEQTFMHLHAFLSLLKTAGLNELMNMAGLEQTALPYYEKYAASTHSSAGEGEEEEEEPVKKEKEPSGGTRARAALRKPPISAAKTSSSAQNMARQSKTLPRESKSVGGEGDSINKQQTLPATVPRDPITHAGGDGTVTRVRGKSRFDDLYQKVMKDTEDALGYPKEHHRGQGDWVEREGMYGAGVTQSGLPLSPRDGAEDGASSEAGSQVSKGSSKASSGGQLKVEDLRSIEDLQEMPPATTPAAPRPGTLGADHGDDHKPSTRPESGMSLTQPSEHSSLPHIADAPSNQYNYSETFEHSPSEVTEDLSQNLSQ